MKKIYSIAVLALFSATLSAQSFTMNNGMLPASYHSGGCTGVTDMDGDGLDDIIVLDESKDLYILYQQNDGTFDAYSCGTVSGDEQWGMCAGDVDNDGHVDVLSGGYYDGVHVINIDGPGDYTQVDYAWADIFMQGCNLADINNDGWLDGFACHDDGHSALLRNTGDGTMENGADMIDLTFYPEVDGNDNSGNYGSVWTDFDRDGDTDCFIAKCRQFINDPYDPRRTNILLVNDGNGNYHDEAAQRGLVNLQQSWTSDFADIDNDGDFDCFLTTHSATLQIYENDGYGYFTNITSGSGLEVSGFFLQAKLVDFDNDGFVDLLHSGGDHGYYHNNGDQTFTLVGDTFENNDTMHSFGIGDLNKDGYLDVYASYGDGYVEFDDSHPDRLFINDGGDNNFIVFDLEGTVSNKAAIGAIVEIHGEWGVQVREVRAGESYGITNCFSTHFGIGDATEVDFVVVNWPSGLVTVIENPEINEWHSVLEEECSAPSATISAYGSTTICPGGTVTLNVDDVDSNYIWSNGETGMSITVTGGGNYNLIVWDNDGCAGTSNTISVLVTPDVAPTLTVNGDLEFCEGGTVELIASNGQSFAWSNGQTSQVITVGEAGTYSVEVTGNCETLESSSIDVVVIDAPDMPVVTDIELATAGTATFDYDGNDVRWYDSETSDTPVATGDSFTTPLILSNTSFWVEDVMVYGNDMGEGGKMINEEGQYHNSPNFYILFDAHEDFILLNVKVFASGEAEREIEVVDSEGNTVAIGTFNIPDGESVVELNFFVPEGEEYGLKCNNSNPQLWRDRNVDVDEPYDFPYDINGIATITNTTVQGDDTDNYYYFFYDWNVITPTFECASPREEVQVTLVGVEELNGVNTLSIYPNPANTSLNIYVEMTESKAVNVRLMDALGRAVIAQTLGTLATGSNNRTLDVSSLAAGVYQIEIEIDGMTATQKVVVE